MKHVSGTGSPVTIRRFGRLIVEAFETRDQLGRSAATDIAASLAATIRNRGSARVVFAAAPSQAEMLAALRESTEVDWSKVDAFHMDEYVGLPSDSPARFTRWLDAHVFDALPFRAVHRLSPEAGVAGEAARYAALLDQNPIDLVCLGVGVNGHIAFNDPPVADFDDPHDVKLVELDDICRQQQVDDGGFATLADVPRTAITLTIPRLLRADRLFCVAPGAAKRQAIDMMLRGPISTACPASILRTHPDCRLYLDEESDLARTD